MFKFIILTIFLLTGYVNTVYITDTTDTTNVYDLVLSNDKFSVNFDYDKIILEKLNINKKYKFNPIITYQNIFEDIYETESEIISGTNPKYKILFDNFIEHLGSTNYIKSSVKINNSNTYFESKYQMISDDTLLVSFYISDFKFKNPNNDLLVSLSFTSGPINYNGKYYLEVQDYIINFSNTTTYNLYSDKVSIERFGNYFYIHFPYFEDELFYNFTIKYEPLC